MESRLRPPIHHDESPKHRSKPQRSKVQYAVESACFSIKSNALVWALFYVTVIAQLFCGIIYIFGVISQTLIANNFTPTQTDFLYACGTLGQYFGIIPGYLHDWTGPIVTCFYGLVCTVVGYGAVCGLLARSLCRVPISQTWVGMVENWAAEVQGSAGATVRCPHMANTPTDATIYMLGAAMFIMTQGGAALHYSVFPTLLMQFSPQRRGLVSGLVAGAYGLSGIVLTSIFQAVFAPTATNGDRPRLIGFIGLVGGIVFVFSLVLLLMLTRVRAPRKSSLRPDEIEKLPLYDYSPQGEAFRNQQPPENTLTVGGGLQRRHSSMIAFEFEESSPATESSTTVASPGDFQCCAVGVADNQQNVSRGGLLVQMVSAKYLIYMLVQALMQGTCAAVIGNVSLIREASLAPDAEAEDDPLLGSHETKLWSVAILVQVISAGNFMGRIVSGIVSQCMPVGVYIMFFIQSAILIGLAQMLLFITAPSSNGVLVAALFCTAWAMGTNFAIGPVWIMQTFSPRHFASLQATVMGSIAVSTFILSMFTGRNYEKNAHLQHLDAHSNGPLHGEHLVCHGPSCFEVPQLLKMSGAAVSAILSASLVCV